MLITLKKQSKLFAGMIHIHKIKHKHISCNSFYQYVCEYIYIAFHFLKRCIPSYIVSHLLLVISILGVKNTSW